MRRNISAILLLFFFISLQFGKVTTYLYCKWQAEIIQNKTDCGCEDHLVSMFDHKDESSGTEKEKLTLNEKLNEFTPKSLLTLPELAVLVQKNFTEYNPSLSESFPEAPFHPPAQSAVNS